MTDEKTLMAALEQAGDWSAFSLWGKERYKQFSGKAQDGWLYLDGPLHLPTLAALMNSPDGTIAAKAWDEFVAEANADHERPSSPGSSEIIQPGEQRGRAMICYGRGTHEQRPGTKPEGDEA